MDASATGLVTHPFAPIADPALWVAIPGAESAYSELSDCLSTGRGIAILTAPAGLGKTLACLRLQRELSTAYRVIFFPGGGLETPTSFLQNVLCELEQPYRNRTQQELRLQLRRALRGAGKSAAGICLLIDEADTLSDEVLEEIRATTNFTDDGRPLVRVLLSGQFPLEEKLTSPRLDALNQRVGCHVHLEPFTRQESTDYIHTRIRAAGDEPADIFDPQAVQTIVITAGGNPRCLNQLCDRALILADRENGRPVDDITVRRALEELKQLPLHWADPPPADDSTRSPADISPVESELDEAEAATETASDGVPALEQTGTAVFEVGCNSEAVSETPSEITTRSASATSIDSEVSLGSEAECDEVTPEWESSSLTAEDGEPLPEAAESEPARTSDESDTVPLIESVMEVADTENQASDEIDPSPVMETATETDDIECRNSEQFDSREPSEVVAETYDIESHDAGWFEMPEPSQLDEQPLEAEERLDVDAEHLDGGEVDSDSLETGTAEIDEPAAASLEWQSAEPMLEEDEAGDDDDEEIGWLFGAAGSWEYPTEDDSADETGPSGRDDDWRDAKQPETTSGFIAAEETESSSRNEGWRDAEWFETVSESIAGAETGPSGRDDDWQDVEQLETTSQSIGADTTDRFSIHDVENVSDTKTELPSRSAGEQTEDDSPSRASTPIVSQAPVVHSFADRDMDDDWTAEFRESDSDAGWESVPTQTPLSRDAVQDGPEVQFGNEKGFDALNFALPEWQSGELVMKSPTTPREEPVEDYYASLRALESLHASPARRHTPEPEPTGPETPKREADDFAENPPPDGGHAAARSRLWDEHSAMRPQPSFDSTAESADSRDSDHDLNRPAPDDMIDSVMAAVEQAASDDEPDQGAEDASDWQARLLSQLVEMAPEDAVDPERFDVVQPDDARATAAARDERPVDSPARPSERSSESQESLRKQVDLFARLRKLRDQF